MGNLKTERLAHAKIIFFEVDGVFTDGKSWQDTSGQWRRSFSVRDTMGLRALRKAGLCVAILTPTLSPEVRAHFDFVGVDVFRDHCLEPKLAIEQILKAKGFSGDDAIFVTENDLGGVKMGFHQSGAIYSSARLSGDGAVLEISNLILQHGAGVSAGQHGASLRVAKVGEL